MRTVEFRLDAPGPIARAFMACRERISVIRGPLGSAKTFTVIQRILAQMCEQPAREINGRLERRSRWVAVRNTYGDLEETTIKDFLAVFRVGEMGQMNYSDPPQFNVAMALKDGSHVIAEVIFLALDRPDSIRKLKGYQVTGFWLNEVSELNKGVVDMADLRHGRFGVMQGAVDGAWHGMIGDTNSYDTVHWLYKLEQHPPPGWAFFRQPGGVLDTGDVDHMGRKVWRLNPEAENLDNLPEDYYSAGMSGKEDDWIKVMLANEFGFTVSGRPVHPRFLHHRHVAKAPLAYNERYPLMLGLDFGRTPAAAIFQRLDHIGRYHVLAELTSEDMSAAIFAPELFRMIRRRWPKADLVGWGDPAGDAQGQATDDTPILICRAAGLPIQPASTNRYALRKAALDNPLMRSCMDGGPAILIDPSCEMLIKALMGGYHYRQLQVSGPEPRISDEPEKNWASHIAEAMHYGLLGAGEIHEALRPPEHMRRPWPEQRPYDPLEHL